MAKNTRKLDIVVSVRDQTRKTLGSISARMKRFADSAARSIKRAFKIGLAAAGVALAAFANEVRKQFDEIDNLAKTAFRFGVAIEEIQGVKLAAELAGLSLSEMLTILRDTARRTSEAAQGTGEAREAIKELGLDAKELNMLPVTRQIDIITKRLGEIENKNDRVRIAYDIMGRSGTKALTLIGTSITEAIHETEMLGTRITKDIGGSVQDVNDEMTRLREAWDGLVRAVLGGGEMTLFLKKLRKAVVEFRLIVASIGLELQALYTRIALLLVMTFEKVSLVIESGILAPLNLSITALNKMIKGAQNLNFIFLRGTKILNAFIGSLQTISTIQPKTGSLFSQIKEDLRGSLREIQQEISDLTNLPPSLPDRSDTKMANEFFPRDGTEDGGGADPGMFRVGRPGIVSGRLLTGAAQSSAERLMSIAKAADEKRRQEAMEAKKQREKSNQLLSDLLRSALANPNANLGGLLQQ